jgi:hypothetical protein
MHKPKGRQTRQSHDYTSAVLRGVARMLLVGSYRTALAKGEFTLLAVTARVKAGAAYIAECHNVSARGSCVWVNTLRSDCRRCSAQCGAPETNRTSDLPLRRANQTVYSV